MIMPWGLQIWMEGFALSVILSIEPLLTHRLFNKSQAPTFTMPAAQETQAWDSKCKHVYQNVYQKDKAGFCCPFAR